MKCSRRSSTHLTGRPSRIAAIGTRISSGHGCTILTPKPPPTSGVITSTRSTGSSSFAAMAWRTLVDVCVDECTRSDRSSASHCAKTPLPSIGIEALRSMRRRQALAAGSRRDPRRGVAVLLHHRRCDVAGNVGVHEVLGCPCLLEADDRRQEVVGHRYERRRVLGDVPVDGDDHRDRLAHMVDLVLRKRIPGAPVRQRRMRDEQRQRLCGSSLEVVVGEDRDQPLDIERRADIDVDDARVRVRAPDECGRERVVTQVVEVAAVAREESWVFYSRHSLAEEPGGH